MIELRETDSNISDYHEIKRICQEAFPKEERPPFCFLRLKARKRIVSFDGIYNGDKLVGFTYVIERNGIAYLFLFAIKKEERGNGYGSQVLKLLKEKYHDHRFFLALEQQDPDAVNYEQRKIRHDFYERCGLRDLPHQIKEASVIYDVMGMNGEIAPEEYGNMMKEYFGLLLYFLYRPILYSKNNKNGD